MSASSTTDYQYEVALSFAGTERPYVEKVAASLRAAGVKYFYDDHEEVSLWGKDLAVHLDEVFRLSARYCVVFISHEYARRAWPSHELRSALARSVTEKGEYILPLRFDPDVELPGLRPSLKHLSANSFTPAGLSKAIQHKLGGRPVKAQFPEKPDRLWKSLGIKSSNKYDRARTQDVASAFYQALTRMTEQERLTVAALLAFGCAAELPTGVHISLDLLSRLTELSGPDILKSLAKIRSLGFEVSKRPDFLHEDDEQPTLVDPDDVDLLLSYCSPKEDGMGDSTSIAHEAVHTAVDHFCENHGLRVITSLDFGRLSSADRRPIKL